MQIDVVALALAIQTAQKQGVPIKRVDFDSTGSFALECGIDAVGFLEMEFQMLGVHQDRYAFSAAAFSEITRFLEDRLARRAEAAGQALIHKSGAS